MNSNFTEFSITWIEFSNKMSKSKIKKKFKANLRPRDPINQPEWNWGRDCTENLALLLQVNFILQLHSCIPNTEKQWGAWLMAPFFRMLYYFSTCSYIISHRYTAFSTYLLTGDIFPVNYIHVYRVYWVFEK